MKVYADTNFFTNLYLKLSHGDEAKALSDCYITGVDATIPVTILLEMEFSNALERCVYESRRGGQWRVTETGAMLAMSAFDGALEFKGFLEERNFAAGCPEIDISTNGPAPHRQTRISHLRYFARQFGADARLRHFLEL